MAPKDFVRQQDRSKIDEYTHRIAETGSGHVEVELLTKGDTTIPYEFYSHTFVDEDGTVIGRVGLGRDISERVEYRDGMERQTHRLEEFASVLTHDLRDHVAIASGKADVLEDDIDQGHGDLADIQDALARIEQIVEDVRERSQTGETVSDVEPIDLGDVTRQAWESVERGTVELTVVDTVFSRQMRVFWNAY